MMKSKWLVVVALLAAGSLSADDTVLKAKPDAVRGQEIAGMKWGMFVCWSMASAINAPGEWVRAPVEPKQFNATDCDTDQWVRQIQPDCFSGFNHGQAAGRISLRERGTPGPIGKATAMANQMANEKSYAFPVAEFTYPINQTYWFFNIAHPEHPNLPATKIYADYCGAVKYGNIFSLDVGPNLAGKLRDMDVQTLRQVGEMIKNPPPAPSP